MYQKIVTYRNDEVDFTTRNLVYLAISSLLVGPKLETEAFTLNCTMLNDTPHYEINCQGNSDDDKNNTRYTRLPVNLDRDATYVHIRLEESPRKSLYIDRMNIFKHFRRLKILHIEANPDGNFNIANDLESEYELREQLFNLPYLQELKIEKIRFLAKRDMWDLPEHLEDLTISYAVEYSEYDLSELRYLRSVNFRGNRFTKLPSFYFPLRSLKILDLRDNPLNEVTINDIAKLCGLEKVYLKGTSFFSTQRYCECLRLMKWIKRLNEMYNEFIIRTEFENIGYSDCVSQNDEYCSISDLDLKEAVKQRELCLAATEDDEL